MTAPESSPLAANLQETIQHLITEAVRQSQAQNGTDVQVVRDALAATLADVEAAQTLLSTAANRLRAALGNEPEMIDIPEPEAPEDDVATVVAEAPELVLAEVTTTGPHTLDVIAHNVTISIATGLQAFLRGRAEVANAQTREFVNGELRLHVQMQDALDLEAVRGWIAEHGGTIGAQTPDVLELRFGS